MRRLLSILVLVFVTLLGAFAQNTLRVEAPNVVALDEQFTVTFILEGDNSPSDFQWTQGADFQLVWGPQQGRSTSVQIINGKKTRSSQFTYTYILMPKKAGSFVLPAATAKVKGEDISSEAASVEVVADASSGDAAQASGGSGNSVRQTQSAGSSNISDDDIFLNLTLDKTSVVIGEPITATLKLYQRVNIAGFEDARFPTFNGFWSQEVEAPSNIEFQRENYNNKIYNTAVLRKYILIPQQKGTITLDPAELVCLVNIRLASTGGASIFDGFFDDYRTIRKRVSSASHKINVSSLPDGAPSSFGGGVGNFQIKAQISKDTLTTHEASSLIITVSGKGNVSLLEAPKVKFPPDFEVYDTKVSEKMLPKSGGTAGSKIYEFPFIPRSHGDFVLDPIKYSYYDINTGKYVTMETDRIVLSVKKGKAQEGGISQSVSVPSVSRHGVRNLGEDIRYVATKMPQMSPKGQFFVETWMFWSIGFLFVLSGLVLWLVFRKMAARRADVVGMKTRKATKMAMRRLKMADSYLKQNLYTAFYEELHKAVVGFVADKLNISIAELSKEKISESLLENGAAQVQVEALIEIIDACEFARYAPDAGNEAMKGHYQAALDVISSIDSSMKNKKIKVTSGAKAGVLILIIMLSLPVVSFAENDAYVDSLWNKATMEYSAGEWESALATYKSIDKLGLESAALYCNIGSAYFKASDLSHAILYFEKSLKLDPSYSDARYNLEIASALTQDNIDPVPEFILKTWTKSLCYSLDSDSWAVLALVLLALTVSMMLVFLLAASSGAKKAGFGFGIAFIVFMFASFAFSVWQKNDYMRADSAIVTVPVSSVKSSPSEEVSKDLFILHEGTKVNILDEVGSWRNIELADGRQGWILSSDMEVI